MNVLALADDFDLDLAAVKDLEISRVIDIILAEIDSFVGEVLDDPFISTFLFKSLLGSCLLGCSGLCRCNFLFLSSRRRSSSGISRRGSTTGALGVEESLSTSTILLSAPVADGLLALNEEVSVNSQKAVEGLKEFFLIVLALAADSVTIEQQL